VRDAEALDRRQKRVARARSAAVAAVCTRGQPPVDPRESSRGHGLVTRLQERRIASAKLMLEMLAETRR
jgi:hypothetical protein